MTLEENLRLGTKTVEAAGAKDKECFQLQAEDMMSQDHKELTRSEEEKKMKNYGNRARPNLVFGSLGSLKIYQQYNVSPQPLHIRFWFVA